MSDGDGQDRSQLTREQSDGNGWAWLTPRRIELYSAALLAAATVATAWCGYQSSRWSGEQRP